MQPITAGHPSYFIDEDADGQGEKGLPSAINYLVLDSHMCVLSLTF